MKLIKTNLIGLAAIGGIIALAGFIQAQVATAPAQSILGNTDSSDSQPDSVVQVVADLQGLPLVPPDQIPRFGTFWIVSGPQPPPPFPFLPPRCDEASTPVYSLGLNGQFLVDATGGMAPQPNRRQAMLGLNTSTLVQAQVNELLDLISQVQDAELEPPQPGDGTNDYGGGGDFGFQAQVFTTNDLWLQITGTTNTGTSITAYLVINAPWNVTNGVYDLFATTNLAPSAWQWALRCNPGQTNLIVTGLSSPNEFFILGLTNDADGDGLTDAFELLVSHTNPNLYSTDGTGMSDGWEWQYFGRTGINPNGDPDGDGLTTFKEWQMRSAGYNPAQWDSNTNGVGDGYEDYSGDVLANLMEAAFGGNMMTNNPAWKVDSDGDGLPDLYETMVGLNPNSAEPAPGLPAYSKNPIP